MRHPLYLEQGDIAALEYEVMSNDLRVYLTRCLDKSIEDSRIININNVVNKSRQLAGLSPYVLKADDMGDYDASEFAWHQGELQVCMLRLDTLELVEYICDLLSEGWLEFDTVNEALEREGNSFRINRSSGGDPKVIVFTIVELEEINTPEAHPNIRVLVGRMDSCLANGDYGGVVHTSASIFETMAKDIVSIPSVQNETLGGFFDRYKRDSMLPEEMLNYIKSVYTDRNSTPLAGHGHTSTPELTHEQATTLSELTKAFVKIEYSLRLETADKPR